MRKWSVISVVYILALILLWTYTGRVAMENRGFVVTGYGVTWGALLWYTFRLNSRERTTARAVESFEVVGAGE
ncbi:MAG: hypothetical protein Q8W46_10050 [Candidatus Palauibacterales bacterium]|jgi:hypothetical protein|nr:hypothetical protein [Candidatus Palauibacterales bacterium]